MRLTRLPSRWIFSVVALIVAAALMAGCGGGGGGGGGSSSSGGGGGASGTYSLSGTVVSTINPGTNPTPISGAIVTLDNNPALASNTTGSDGAWAINNIPASDITNTNSHVLIVNYLGTDVARYNLPAFAAGNTSQSGIQITANTPPPPPTGPGGV